MALKWSSTIRVMGLTHVDRSISETALALVNDHMQVLVDAVISEILQKHTAAELISVADVEEVVKLGLQGGLATDALDRMRKARESAGQNSGLVFEIKKLREQLNQRRDGRLVQKGVCASLAALLESVCAKVLDLSFNYGDSPEIEPSQVEGAIRLDPELDLLFNPDRRGRHMIEIQLGDGEVVDACEAKALAREAADGGMTVSRKGSTFPSAWLRQTGFEMVCALLALPRVAALMPSPLPVRVGG